MQRTTMMLPEELRDRLRPCPRSLGAERLGETKLASLDHRHFSVLRARHCEALRLLPA
jgi:hypothetical protein